MRTSDPAVALRIGEPSAVAAAPLPSDGDPTLDPTVSCNLGADAPYARVRDEPRRWLTLVADDEPPPPAAPTLAARGTDATADPLPMAAPIDGVIGSTFGSSAALRELLDAANEHRRVVDLIWTAHEFGAVQLPAALVTRLERARAAWPAALSGLSVGAAPA